MFVVHQIWICLSRASNALFLCFHSFVCFVFKSPPYSSSAFDQNPRAILALSEIFSWNYNFNSLLSYATWAPLCPPPPKKKTSFIKKLYLLWHCQKKGSHTRIYTLLRVYSIGPIMHRSFTLCSSSAKLVQKFIQYRYDVLRFLFWSWQYLFFFAPPSHGDAKLHPEVHPITASVSLSSKIAFWSCVVSLKNGNSMKK